MNKQEYEEKKYECWLDTANFCGFPTRDDIKHSAFDAAFDRAYELGKETETITQKEIEKTAEEYVLTRQQARHNAKREEDATLRDFDKTIKAWDAFDMAQAYEDGANFVLGKQENDADKEEMLTCVKDQAVMLYDIANKAYAINGDKYYEGYMNAMINLFGSKCLPDEEPKPAEPTTNYMRVDYHGADTAASTIADGCQSQPVTDCHDFNRIVKDGFRGHNRLHIAAQMVAALYANHQAAKGFKSIEELVRKALDIADTLIKESEKGVVE